MEREERNDIPARVDKASGTRRNAVLPVDAYSLAVSCGDRGVSLDIWPASLIGTLRAMRRPLSGHVGEVALLVAHDTSRHDLVFRHAGLPAPTDAISRALGGFLAVGGTPLSARYGEHAVQCIAMRRPRCCAAQPGHMLACRVCPECRR